MQLLRMSHGALAETIWPRRAVSVGLMIFPKLEVNGPRGSAVEYARD
jgi:hypothetical protein